MRLREIVITAFLGLSTVSCDAMAEMEREQEAKEQARIEQKEYIADFCSRANTYRPFKTKRNTSLTAYLKENCRTTVKKNAVHFCKSRVLKRDGCDVTVKYTSTHKGKDGQRLKESHNTILKYNPWKNKWHWGGGFELHSLDYDK
ncbi:hypothetical protein ACFL96_07565 [Thermoproteota archaeon]